MEWNLKRVNSTDCECQDGFLFLSFAGGPLAMLRIFNASEISPDFLVSSHFNLVVRYTDLQFRYPCVCVTL